MYVFNKFGDKIKEQFAQEKNSGVIVWLEKSVQFLHGHFLNHVHSRKRPLAVFLFLQEELIAAWTFQNQLVQQQQQENHWECLN